MELSERQQEAVNHPLGPLLIVAGAGSGKTRTLTSRIVSVLSAGAAPHSILAITFTNKAAHAMRERIASSLGAEADGLFIGTFHALGARFLRRLCVAFKRTSGFSIFDAGDSLRLLRAILKDPDLRPLVPKTCGPVFFMRRISALKNEVADPPVTDTDKKTDALVRHVAAAYERALIQNNAFDFDDLIEKPVRALRADGAALAAYRARYRHVFVDEYQDINTAQYLLVSLLAGEHRNVSVVGDDAQAIYSFRGADFRNFLNFDADWPDAKTVFLDENYRSAGNIINAASAVIAHNAVQKKKTLWTRNADGEPVLILEAAREDEEARAIATRIAELCRGGTKDIAVLYRTNAQSRPLEQELSLAGIPYRIFGGLRFYERMEIKDILAALTLVRNPQNAVCRERLETHLPKYRRKNVIEDLQRMTPVPAPFALIKRFLEITEYPDHLRRQYTNADERLENIAELASFAGTFASLDEFLERVSLLDASDPPVGGQPHASHAVVNLSTIHLAKGLEFDAVFVAGCTEGILPHQSAIRRIKPDDIEEERRLMYVAMTRAKKRLTLSFYDLPSRFLSEIPSHYTAFESASAKHGRGRARALDDEERYIVYE